jgi:hypothetical protein
MNFPYSFFFLVITQKQRRVEGTLFSVLYKKRNPTTWGVTNVQLISQNTVTVCFLSSYQLLVIPVDVKRRKKERNTQEFLPRRSTEAAAG